jgi:high affinity Mn2+ porin
VVAWLVTLLLAILMSAASIFVQKSNRDTRQVRRLALRVKACLGKVSWGAMRQHAVPALFILMFSHSAYGADFPVKAPETPASYDWTGFYAGAQIDYQAGQSRWRESRFGAAGEIEVGKGYDFSSGTGSYAIGFQGRYDYMDASHHVFGLEGDIWFPNTVSGNETFATAAGSANYSETIQFSGTLRARLGYAAGSWLFYLTGGFAWSFDQFAIRQIAGGNLPPGTVESQSLVPRYGGAVGVGTQVALNDKWSARIEYLFVDYASRDLSFPATAERFDSSLALQTIRIGLDYKLGEKAIDPDLFTKEVEALELDRFAFHGQTTFIEQYAAPFRSPYIGPHSLSPDQGRESLDFMYFAGVRLWKGAEFWVDPEFNQGFGLSNTEGIAGFPSGAAFKVGSAVPYARIQRAFVRQTIDLGGNAEKVAADQNQFAGSNTTDRLVITVGKFSVSDVFDQNKYAQNPRKDFMNWALIDTGSYDYAADAWGYTYGAAAEWYQGPWTVRAGVFDVSTEPNSQDLDTTFKQFQLDGEIERRYQLWNRAGKIAVTGFLTRARLGTYADAIALAQATGMPADIAAVRQYRSRSGLGVNLEQEATDDLGVFARAGFASGDVEADSYTDIDRTLAAGVSLAGKRWGRPDDTFGFAAIANAITPVHAEFLNLGGLGILVGDGQLPHPGVEQIMETYYQFPIYAWKVMFDYQFVVNPAYNRDRGPVSIAAIRLHSEF